MKIVNFLIIFPKLLKIQSNIEFKITLILFKLTSSSYNLILKDNITII